MREENSGKVAEPTGRSVLVMMSTNHIDPDLAAEIYVLDGPPDHSAVLTEIATDGQFTDIKLKVRASDSTRVGIPVVSGV